jgi:hypothetical protein
MLSLPPSLVSPAQHQQWQRYRNALPPVATVGQGPDWRIAIGSSVSGPACNTENPELYAVFPFRLFSAGTSGLAVGRQTFWHRVFSGNRGWQQDDIQAAFLGLADIASTFVADRFQTSDPASRFPAFWGPNANWIPDQDHGGVGLMALQSMIVQSQKNQILVFPAWPRSWNVEFKLHAPQHTVVSGLYRDGKWLRLDVEPRHRAHDLVLLPAQ